MASAVIEALLAGFQASLLYMCAVVIMSLCGVVIAVNVRRQMKVVRRKLKGSAAVAMAILAVSCTLLARKGRVTVTDPYIRDAGSYLTNDIVHVAIAKRTPLLPDDAIILVYARQVDSTNVTDWVRLSPHLTFADHPYDYALPNATNYDVMVAADFTPAPTVHTNGVWQIKGFTIPGTGKAAFPNTKTIRKE
jgi:predicted nucleic acid-binding protein